MLTINTKMKVNQVCFMAVKHGPSTPTRSTDPMHFIYAASGLLDITWQDHVPNKIVLAQAGIPNMFALLAHRHLRWLSHVSCMEDWIPRLKQITDCTETIISIALKWVSVRLQGGTNGTCSAMVVNLLPFLICCVSPPIWPPERKFYSGSLVSLKPFINPPDRIKTRLK